MKNIFLHSFFWFLKLYDEVFQTTFFLYLYHKLSPHSVARYLVAFWGFGGPTLSQDFLAALSGYEKIFLEKPTQLVLQIECQELKKARDKQNVQLPEGGLGYNCNPSAVNFKNQSIYTYDELSSGRQTLSKVLSTFLKTLSKRPQSR